MAFYEPLEFLALEIRKFDARWFGTAHVGHSSSIQATSPPIRGSIIRYGDLSPDVLVSILTLTFFLLLGRERFVNGTVQLFAEPQRPLVRRILQQSAGAVSGYITGNLAISFVCGVITFIVLVVLGMPYPAALALLVALLDLIPLVGATLGGALLVIVGLFVSPFTALILLIYILIYQQVEGSVLQPMVYSRAVQLNALLIFVAVLVGAALLGIPGALLAIPVAEIIRVIVTDVLAYRRMRRGEEEPAVSSPASQPPA